MGLIIQFFGIFGLIFRIWISEVKCKVPLGHRKRYISRFLSYFLFVAMIYDFQNMTYNIIMVSTLPFMIFAVIKWDMVFFKKLFKNEVEEWKDYKFWMFLERATMHPVNVFFQIIPFFTGLRMFVVGSCSEALSTCGLICFIFAMIIVFSTFCLFDTRYVDKRGWPMGKYMLIMIFIGTLISGVYLFLVD